VNTVLNRKVALAGGGTGGHTVAAAVIGRIAEDSNVDAFWIARGDSFESRVAQDAGIRFVPLDIYKLKPLNTLKIASSIMSARRILAREHPALVVATGSWVCIPVAFAALSRRVPLVVHEQTIIPGRSSRFLSRMARETWISFSSSRNYFRVGARVIHTGFPLRPELKQELTRTQALKQLGLDEAPTLYVAGGGNGSESLNAFVARNLGVLLSRWQIIHQAGSSNILSTDVDALRQAAAGLDPVLQRRYCVRDFLTAHEVNAAIRGSALIVARAGAAFCNEVQQLGAPCVLVPFPHSRGGEQQALAAEVAAGGQALVWSDAMLKDDEASCISWLSNVTDDQLAQLDRRASSNANKADYSVAKRLTLLLAEGRRPRGRHVRLH
jgi:UDP-N-acetylglucosamine--N-acetylmuramyl-(pentapeptide) pyrophosphoryl-undecaprenol N-acetylglucosamine transferase